jgi:hypothetical protein
MNETCDNKNRSDLENAGDIFDKVHDILNKAGYTVNQVTPQALEQCLRKEENPKTLYKGNSSDKAIKQFRSYWHLVIKIQDCLRKINGGIHFDT